MIHAFKRRLLPAVVAVSLSVAMAAQTDSAPVREGATSDLTATHLNVLQVVALLIGVGGFIWHAAVLKTMVYRNDKHTHEMRNRIVELIGVLHRIDRRLLQVELKIGVTTDDDDAPKTPVGVEWFAKD